MALTSSGPPLTDSQGWPLEVPVRLADAKLRGKGHKVLRASETAIYTVRTP
jgi:hypothetical protein